MFDNKDQEYAMPDADRTETTKAGDDAMAAFNTSYDPYTTSPIPWQVAAGLAVCLIGIMLVLCVATS